MWQNRRGHGAGRPSSSGKSTPPQAGSTLLGCGLRNHITWWRGCQSNGRTDASFRSMPLYSKMSCSLMRLSWQREYYPKAGRYTDREKLWLQPRGCPMREIYRRLSQKGIQTNASGKRQRLSVATSAHFRLPAPC